MQLATKGGKLLFLDNKLATDCNCCGVQVCSNIQCPTADYERISNIVFRLTFSNFGYERRLGIFTVAQSACDAQYGTSGFLGITQPSFYNEYIDLANNFSIDLFFEPSLTSPTVPFFWAGSGSATSTSGVTVTTYYNAAYRCTDFGTLQFSYGPDIEGYTIPSYDSRQLETCSQGLRIVGPRVFSNFGIFGGGFGQYFQCGNRNNPFREFYTDDAYLFVSCGLATTSQGCVVPQDSSDDNYYRIRLRGNALVTAYANGLP